MPARVVELFEMVQVEHADHQLLPGGGQPVQVAPPGAAVRQPGERIGEGLIVEVVKGAREITAVTSWASSATTVAPGPRARTSLGQPMTSTPNGVSPRRCARGFIRLGVHTRGRCADELIRTAARLKQHSRGCAADRHDRLTRVLPRLRTVEQLGHDHGHLPEASARVPGLRTTASH